MDIDSARVIWSLAIIEPEWISKPGVALGEGDYVAGPLVLKVNFAALFSAVKARHSRQLLKDFLHARHIGRVPNIDVGKLMIAHGKGPAFEGVQRLSKRAGPCG